jgi:hypothetical protein
MSVDRGAPTFVPFDQVVKVQRVTHRVRNFLLIGLGVGLATGAWAERPGDDTAPFTLTGFFGGIGAGAGAGIGVFLNVLHRHGDVIYDAKPRTTIMALTPILSPTRKGVALSMTWR